MLLLLIAGACGLSEPAHALGTMKRMQAQDYFDAPAQVELIKAVDRGDTERMRRAIEAGADVNAVGRQGMAPLFWALTRQNLSVFKFLLDQGANANLVTHWNQNGTQQSASVLDFAAGFETPEYLRALLEHGGDPNGVINTSGESVIFSAIMHRRLGNVKLLMAQGADVNYRDSFNDTPIRTAVLANLYEIALFLLKAGADPTIVAKSGTSAIDFVVRYGDRGVDLRSNNPAAYVEFVAELRKRGLLK